MTHNILISLATFILILISSLAMYLPLCALTKNKIIGLRYAIPFSISIEIIIGYIFYCTSTMTYFPLFYLIFAILINIWAYYKLRPIAFKKISLNWMVILAVSVVSIVIIYTRCYDGFKFIGPGSNDTYNHLIFVKDLIRTGYLSNGFYAPGFHLFLMPIAKIIPFADLYRFAGPAIGIVTLGSFVLLFKDYLKNKILLIFLLALLALPVYNQFTLQTIGFFSSALTFIYFASFIVLISDQDIKKRKLHLSFFLIFTVALALTVPYLFVVILPAALIIFFVVLIFQKRFNAGYPRYLLTINLILIVGFVVSFGHIYIQSNILKRYSGFPRIATTYYESDGTQVITLNNELADTLHLPRFIKNNSFLRPMVGTGYDLLRVKNIRSAKSVLGLGAYLWIAFSFFLLAYASRKKNTILLTVAVLSVFFGLCAQTGMFEMSNYRGRSGWYLLMLSIFGLVLFTDQVYSKKMFQWVLVGSVIIAATGFYLPPQYYRTYYGKEFEIVIQIARSYPDKKINLIASNHELSMVAENITAQDFIPENLVNSDTFLILEKEILCPDPVLSQGAVSTDKNFVEYNKQFEASENKLKSAIDSIKSDENFKKYNKYFENEDFVIYENIKK